jgi:hypothetical protein
MENIVDKIFGGYNNHYDLEKRFYDDLVKRLRNEPNKIEFLLNLKQMIDVEFGKHNSKCKEDECGYPKLKEKSINIIDAIIQEKMEQKEIKQIINNDNSVNKINVTDSKGVNITQNINNENKNWFKKNIHYIYYSLAILGIVYTFIKWVYPYLIH